jgi:6-phosphogluconolactonase (cycloisomerase 2 family)
MEIRKISIYAITMIALTALLVSCGGGGGGGGGGDKGIHSISGIVSGATQSGVTIVLSGDSTASTTTDANGNYRFDGLAGQTYTVTPSKEGYIFDPQVRTSGGWCNSSNICGDITDANFNAYSASPAYYTVTYNGNGNIGGSVPVDSIDYQQGQAVTVLGNTGNLAKTNYAFAGWNTKADGSGTTYVQGGTFTIGSTNVILYAKWTTPIYAYVANYGSDTVSQYTIGANGALTPMPTPTVSAGSSPTSVTVDPSGKYVYVANYGNSSVSQYTIGANGALTPISPATAWVGTSPESITVNPSGKYAYVANWGSGTVSQYTIGANGALTAMTTATVAAGYWPNSIKVHPSGRYAYVSNGSSNNVSQYTINANGELTPMAAPTVAAGTSPWSVTVDLSGSYAYVANWGSGTISQYTIGSNGALIPMSTATVAAGTNPACVVTTGTNQ